MIYSMFLTEHIIVDGVNNKFKITNSSSTVHEVELTTGTYVSMNYLRAEIDSALTNADSSQDWEVVFSGSDGKIGIASNATFAVDFDVTNYGTMLRDKLGFTSNSFSGANSYTANTYSEGYYKPSEPIESDDRPETIGSDQYEMDIFTTESRGGVISSKGGNNKIYSRSVSILMTSDDFAQYTGWLDYTKNRKFRFFHDYTKTWPGPNSEYKTYKLMFSDSAGWSPEFIDANRVWFRVSLDLRQV